MRLKGRKIGFAVTGSHCTISKVLPEIKKLISEGAEVYPILSQAVRDTDTRFGLGASWKGELEALTGHRAIATIVEAEPIGPQKLLDALIIAPCTGNTLAKLANGITDTPVLMAAKAVLRNQRPVVIAISTNDGLGANARNLGLLLNTKNIYLVPFRQDDPHNKANSLIADMNLILETTLAALAGRQLQPLLLGPGGGGDKEDAD
ncbi:MAG: dipicolinate synthase subunit B [Thermanaeromonas sp.]|uniref:dipicolinate synthase subunit B n=1 Tax=Thermanaeromonas sp. TaxID=2003697 RepID=UPI00243E4E09|nr:dipicolinate synthase subunit B [Thermanaeromonas sp.]MCG0278613.1 dipicolinate synthase subunit B [Thermanaeromonas sp.]